MPKFEITQLRSPAAGQPLGYQSNLPDVGGAAIANAVGNVGNTLFKIAEKAIAAETAESVSTAVGQATTELAALGAAKDLKTMGITEAVPEYQRRAKELYGRLSGALSPGARNAFNRQWSQMAAQAGVTFTGNVVNRSIQATDGQNIKNLDKRIIAASNGIFTLRSMSDGEESVRQIQVAGVIGAPVAEKRIIAFRTRFAKQAIVGVINRSTTIDSLNGIKNLLKDDGKELKGDLSKHWKSLDAEDRRTIYSKALADLGVLQRAETKSDAAKEKAADDDRIKLGGRVMMDVMQVAADEDANPDVITRVKTYTSDWFRQQIAIGNIKPATAKAAMTIIQGMGDAQTDGPAVNDLTQRIYAIADMPQPQQKAALDRARDEITDMIAGGRRSRLEVADATRLNALITQIEKGGFKESPQFKARAALLNALGVGTTARPRRGRDPDPQQDIRIERAMRDYDNRVTLYNESPWVVYQDILERAGAELPQQDSYPSLRFGPRKLISKYTDEDFEQVTRDATLYLKQGRIKQGAWNDIMRQTAEIKMIRLRLNAIKNAKGSAEEDPDAKAKRLKELIKAQDK